MAIELHHLNTHGMMERAGKVLDGVVRLKERIAELEKENAELKEQYRDMDVTHTVHIAKMNAYIRELEEAQRWRKFSEEKPEHHQWILAYYDNHSQFTTGVELRRWDNGMKYDVEVQEVYSMWMPLPLAPEEK